MTPGPTRLVAVAGASPGAGKSTLCAGIVDWLRGRGLRVDHFKEADVLTRDAFAPLAHEFTTTGEVQLHTLLETTSAYLTDVEQQDVDVAVTDALVPFVPSLMGWGHSETVIGDFLDDLAERIAVSDPVVVYLDDDPDAAVPRAVKREGPAWQDWLVNKLSQYPVEPKVHDVRSACDYLHYERDVTLRLLTDLPWEVVVIDQTDPPSADGVQRLARERLTESLNRLNDRL